MARINSYSKIRCCMAQWRWIVIIDYTHYSHIKIPLYICVCVYLMISASWFIITLQSNIPVDKSQLRLYRQAAEINQSQILSPPHPQSSDMHRPVSFQSPHSPLPVTAQSPPQVIAQSPCSHLVTHPTIPSSTFYISHHQSTTFQYGTH